MTMDKPVEPVIERFDSTISTEWLGEPMAPKPEVVVDWLRMEMKRLNIGSGQRRFDTARGWLNIDCVSRPPDQVPDLICDAFDMYFIQSESIDCVCLHHVLEHFGCGEAAGLLKECWRLVKPGGSLLLFVPDMLELATRWSDGRISDFTFFVNTYGAYQGREGDRHKWGYSWAGLYTFVRESIGNDCRMMKWHPRSIPGADIAWDWWILGMEVVK